MALRLESDLQSLEVPIEWQGLDRTYARMTIPELLDELGRINSQQERRTRLDVSQMLSERMSEVDQPVVRSPRTDAPSLTRDQERRPSPTPQPGALDLLISGRRVGPKLAARLVMASAKSRRR